MLHGDTNRNSKFEGLSDSQAQALRLSTIAVLPLGGWTCDYTWIHPSKLHQAGLCHQAYMCVVASDHAWAGHFPRYRRYRGKDGTAVRMVRGHRRLAERQVQALPW